MNGDFVNFKSTVNLKSIIMPGSRGDKKGDRKVDIKVDKRPKKSIKKVFMSVYTQQKVVSAYQGKVR